MQQIFLEEALFRRGLTFQALKGNIVSAYVWAECDGEEYKHVINFKMASNGALIEIVEIFN